MTPPREGKGEGMAKDILEQLKGEALYAQRSFSRELLYQTHGKAQMARQLEALTQPEFMAISHMTVHFMNTDREYIRHQNKEYFAMCGRKEEGT